MSKATIQLTWTSTTGWPVTCAGCSNPSASSAGRGRSMTARTFSPITSASRRRRGSRMNKLIPLRTALESPDWLGSVLGAPSYATVRALLLAALGEPLTPSELDAFTQITGRTEAPSEPVAECWLIAGRRSGKTLAIAVLAAFLAGCCDHRHVLAPVSGHCHYLGCEHEPRPSSAEHSQIHIYRHSKVCGARRTNFV